MKGKLNKNFYVFASVLLVLIGIFLIIYFTIIKNPSSLSMVSGTEYISGEQGQVIIRLEDSKENPLTNADCLVSILNPDKSFFIVDEQMQTTSVAGNYYITFITPEAEGVYEEHIVCDIGGRDIHVSSSFHVSAGLNLVAEMFSAQQTQFQRVIGDILVTQELLQNNVENITERLAGVEITLNASLEENQAMLLQKFSEMGGAMFNIFGNSS